MHLWDDVRFAVRRLRQQPAFAAVAITTLALGLGANTAIFTLLYGVMLRPLPVMRPEELVRLGNNNNCCVNTGLQRDYSLFSLALAAHLRAEVPGFSEVALFQANTTPTGIRPEGKAAVSLPAAYVSANYFRTLGVSPFAGRLLEPGDDAPGAAPAMVLSYRAWMEQFGGDRAVVGRPFYVSGVAVTLVGIAAPTFFGETVRPNPAGAWLALGQERLIRGETSALTLRPDVDWLYVIGRAPGASLDAMSARATQAIQAWLSSQTFLSERDRSQIGNQRIIATSAASGVQLMRGNFGQSLTVLFAMSGLVLLIAAANLANLLLARADRVQSAIRAALGASAGRLARQSLIEGLVLALAGCAGAFLVSVLASRAIVALAFAPGTVLPVGVLPSAEIVLFAVGLAVVTGLLFAAAPAWAMGRTNPIDALRGLAREGAHLAFLPRRSLVVVQVTLSMVLLVGAGLLARSLSELENQPMGFEPDDRLVVRIDPPQLSGDPERLAAIYATMQERLQRVPGVRRATYSLYSPMEGNNWSSGIAIAGRPVNPENRDSSSWNRIGPGYFETMGTKVVRGRAITEADTPASERVAVVNLAFVRRFLADRDPIGVGVGIGDAQNSQDYRIVGVVEDVKYTAASQPTRPMMFLPVMQRVEYEDAGTRQVQARSTLVRTIELHVASGIAGRTGALEPEIRRALAEVHPDITVTRVVPMDVQIAGNFRNNRLLATLASAYGLVALALAALGLYGVTSYGVSRRQHEIGVRMALGADGRRIVLEVLRGALLQTAIGLVIGVPLALWGSRALATQLYEVNSRDPGIVAIAAVTLIVSAALSALLPARRASSVDPTRALRAQ